MSKGFIGGKMETNVISISRKGELTLGEVRQIIPVIRKFTSDIKSDIDDLLTNLEACKDNPVRSAELEAKVNHKMDEWTNKVTRLGGISKGLWLVDFDSGDGFYCWKHPEPDVMYWHSYNEGFNGRIPIEQKIQVDHHF